MKQWEPKKDMGSLSGEVTLDLRFRKVLFRARELCRTGEGVKAVGKVRPER